MRRSTPTEEGTLNVSKYLKFQALLDVAEMESLLQEIAPFCQYVVSNPVTEDSAAFSVVTFIEHYAQYVSSLKAGEVPESSLARPFFSSILTNEPEAVYALPLKEERFLIKAIRPVIQLQQHQFYYSPLDKKFHSMVLGKESISWGLQFSFPQIYQDPKTQQIAKVENTPNVALFKRLALWMRHNTSPTPFYTEGKRTNVPMRLGKQCFNWVNGHPNLQKKGIQVLR